MLALTLPVLTAAPSSAAELGGMVSFEDFYSSDSGAGSRHSVSGRVKLDVTKFGPSGKLGFHFDGRQRFDLSGESGTSSKEGRIDLAHLEYTSTSLYLSVGRLWPKDMPIEVVDGLNVVFQGSKAGVGAFAGLRPNPYSQSTTVDYTTAGLYTTYASEKLNGAAAFVHNGFKGKTDRQYIYGYGTWTPRPSLFAFGNVTADLSPAGKLSLTNLIAELTWRPDDIKSFTFGYNQFRAFKFYASTLFADIDDSRQDAWYLGASYRLNPQYMVYGRVEMQKRYFPSLESEQNDMLSYRAGVSGDNLFGTGVAANLSASITDSYGSEYTAYSFDMSRMFGESIQVILNGSYTESVYGSEPAGEALSYGGSVYYMARRYNFSLTLDREQGTDYTSDRLLTRLSFNL
ncbi:hypothetical protein BAC1_01067 [uncultured bacterium]|nr:hypothetical protein BAC1_01067 [uncultured bacterium]